MLILLPGKMGKIHERLSYLVPALDLDYKTYVEQQTRF